MSSAKLLLSVILAGSPETPKRPQSHVDDAVQRFEAGDYPGAIAGFQKSYEGTGRPEHLFNIGRVYEAAGNIPQAKLYYKQFLSHEDAPPQGRATCRARLEDLGAGAPTSPPPPAPPPVANDEKPRPRGPRGRRKNRLPKWAVVTGSTLIPLGSGAVAGGTALALTALTNARNARESAAANVEVTNTDHYRLARTQAIAGDVLLASGAAMVLVGAVTLLAGAESRHVGERRRRRRTSMSVLPRRQGVSVALRF